MTEAAMSCIPFGGIQLWNPVYRTMPLEQIEEASQIDTEYRPYGYNLFLFCRDTSTIHAFRT